MTFEQVCDEFGALEGTLPKEEIPVVIRTAVGDVSIANIEHDKARNRIVVEMGNEEIP
jgi:hypothetical protein